MSDLQEAVMTECLKVSRLAMAIFDATEADRITPETAREIVEMNRAVHDIHTALVTMVVTRR